MAKMLNVMPGETPENDAGYLEMMTRVIFMSGLNRQVVDGKWDGFLEAFEQFDPHRVASFREEDIERLSEDERIIRYAAKIRAVVKNAGRMVDITNEHGSFGQWLHNLVSEEGLSETVKTLAREFSYVSEESASRYLYAVGVDVGDVPEEIRRKYGP